MKLDAFIKTHGLTGEEFAAKAGISRSDVSKYRSGRSKPKDDAMRKIFAATNGLVTPNDFYDLPEPPLSPSSAESAVTP